MQRNLTDQNYCDIRSKRIFQIFAKTWQKLKYF